MLAASRRGGRLDVRLCLSVKLGLENEFHDFITVKAAIVWRDDKSEDEEHLAETHLAK